MPRSFALAYVSSWSLACVIALGLLLHDRRGHAVVSSGYARFLLRPWKVVTFLVGASFFTFAAPYTGDPTWDRIDGSMMAFFTFVSAPWAVGTLYRATKRKASLRQAYVACVAWLFSSSWCYDVYLFWRDGAYPHTWWVNLCASGVLYLCAGLFWSVTVRAEGGVSLAFLLDDWLAFVPVRGRALMAMAGVALLFMGVVVVAMFPFVTEIVHELRSAR